VKKLLCLAMLVVLSVGLVGCGGKAQPKAGVKADYPTKPITLIVSFSAGGGTDLGARLLAPYLEKELGVPVVVENKPGGGGWIGYTEMLKSKPDGYTLGYVNTPGLITGYLNPSAKRQQNLDSFSYIANHVIDPGVIAVRADDNRFNTIQELVDYAKKHEMTATTNGVGSGNHFASLEMNKELGTKIKPVHFAGTGEALTAVLGGHVDIFVVKVGEILEPVKDKQFKVLGVMSKERVPQFPNVPTLRESVGEVINTTVRGVAASKDLDPKILAKLQTAFQNAMKNPEHIQKLEKLGLVVDGRTGDEFKKLLKEEEKIAIELKPLLGW
jgi:tripartite-type tricarboxylate transporter receptor subunit TctC